MSRDLAKLFAKRFIQRSDVKAIQFEKDAGQFHAGDWFPDIKIDANRRPDSPHLPHGFNMKHLLAHLNGEHTYGHYLLDAENNSKLFAFDVDLITAQPDKDIFGSYVKLPDWREAPEKFEDAASEEAWFMKNAVVSDGVSPLDLWHDRKAKDARSWYKYQMKMLAHILLSKIQQLDLDCAAAYTGNKGIHVYGFTGSMPTVEVRAGALLVMEQLDEFVPLRGKNFFKHKNDDPIHGFPNFTVEVFPKQDTLEGKSLGNLMRLPLGVNWKSPKDPTFFLDMTTPLGQFTPHSDPIKLLEGGNPFA